MWTYKVKKVRFFKIALIIVSVSLIVLMTFMATVFQEGTPYPDEYSGSPKVNELLQQ